MLLVGSLEKTSSGSAHHGVEEVLYGLAEIRAENRSVMLLKAAAATAMATLCSISQRGELLQLRGGCLVPSCQSVFCWRFVFVLLCVAGKRG